MCAPLDTDGGGQYRARFPTHRERRVQHQRGPQELARRNHRVPVHGIQPHRTPRPPPNKLRLHKLRELDAGRGGIGWDPKG